MASHFDALESLNLSRMRMDIVAATIAEAVAVPLEQKNSTICLSM